MAFPYQIGLLGDFGGDQKTFKATVKKRFTDLGFSSADVKILTEPKVGSREPRAPFVAVFFGYDGATTTPALDDIIAGSNIILPIYDPNKKFSSQVPKEIRHINGLKRDPADPAFERATTTILEQFRLLRGDRRIFISYKQDDSRMMAAQLYTAFAKRNFDVFLDTNSVPPAKDFQAVLWHRLADSDVVVVLDTPHFLESRWTEEELTRANATSIQVLHMLWPGQSPTASAALSNFFEMTPAMFEGSNYFGDDARLTLPALDTICVEVEALRARALAARHRYLVDAFCDAARARKLRASVQPNRHIILKGPKGRRVVVPMIGVPSALRLHDVFNEVDDSGKEAWSLYDERGLLKEVTTHLEWLNLALPLHAVSVFEVTARLDQEARK